MNSFFARRYVIAGIFLTIILVLLAKLFYMQVIDDRYSQYAKNNVVRQRIQYPARGPILDRYGKILVQNEPVYDLMVTPNQVKNFDTLEFCKLIGIDTAQFHKQFLKALKYSPYRASAFEKQLSVQAYAAFQERLFEFPGFFVQPNTKRIYPDSSAAQFLGYVGEVSDYDIEHSNGYYHLGDQVGVSGVERSYDTLLRGVRGVRNVMVNSHNVEKGSFANGLFDTSAVAGERLISSLDSRLQKLGEKLMHNKVGSVVAIEPSTGEILAFVSSPTYDPNMLVGRERGNNVARMYKDPYSPFLVRPIQARYSPGSSFKPLDALIALQEGVITPQTTFFCPHYYQNGRSRVKCEHFDGPTDLRKGIAQSCNTYFCNVFSELINHNGGKKTDSTYADWKRKVNKFGYGRRLGIDLPHENSGTLPGTAYYDKAFGKNHWRASTVMSLAIGQGELNATPLQMANIDCIIANRGYYYTPHLIRAIGDKNIVNPKFIEQHNVGIDSGYFKPVIDGMQEVVESGTAAAARIPGIVMCGKTGTVQNNRGKNHSVFVAFAPRDNPKIAIAVVVENAGFGASWAAPIASYMVETYLRGRITKPAAEVQYIMDKNLLPPPPHPPGWKPPVMSHADSVKADSIKRLRKDTLRNKKLKEDTTGKKGVPHKNAPDTAAHGTYSAMLNRKEDE